MLLKNTIEGVIIKWAHQIDEVRDNLSRQFALDSSRCYVYQIDEVRETYNSSDNICFMFLFA